MNASEITVGMTVDVKGEEPIEQWYPGEILSEGSPGYYWVHYRFPPDIRFPMGGGCSGIRSASELRRRERRSER